MKDFKNIESLMSYTSDIKDFKGVKFNITVKMDTEYEGEISKSLKSFYANNHAELKKAILSKLSEMDEEYDSQNFTTSNYTLNMYFIHTTNENTEAMLKNLKISSFEERGDEIYKPPKKDFEKKVLYATIILLTTWIIISNLML